ncbi:hypothetical protein WJX72_010204 [[Myrmecia] bisecta]|uniref:Protein ROOT HAIR DEFECTIVE 3 homolog n=1 Tax=[Myrmecia] bisecta TaxID=41462 RepID=A0AAW1QTK1_9CHLO
MGGILQVVTGDGQLNADQIKAFIDGHKLAETGVDYQVVAITGPQSSGKSTLMNILFGTKFEEMDALSGRNQTTKGIWLAKSDKIDHPATLVMDLEGSDGRERGEDDTSFERQSALFALAVADVLLVNMWAKDIGRETGAGKPLLKTIFQVNLKLFEPAPNKQRTVLLFVFRDRTKTPLSRLQQTWAEDLTRMWASIAKPPQYEDSLFTDFFEVQYAALPNFEDREEEFRAESVLLRRRFTMEEEDSLVRVSNDKLPGHALELHIEKCWEVIKEQKDLNLPAHKVMVANIRCAQIMEDQLAALAEDQAWLQLSATALAQLVPAFGATAAALISSCIAGYDEEARYFEAGVRQAKREELVARVLALFKVAHDAQLRHLQAKVLHGVKVALEPTHTGSSSSAAMSSSSSMGPANDAPAPGFSAHAAESRRKALQQFAHGLQDLFVAVADWDTQAAQHEMVQSIDAYIEGLKQAKVAEVQRLAERCLADALAGPAISLLDHAPADLWPRLGKLLASAAAKAEQVVSEGLVGYDLSEEEQYALATQLDSFANGKLEGHVQEAAHTALSRMKDKFTEVFSRDEKGMPRAWGPRANIPAVTQRARLASAKVLAQLAILRIGAPQELGEAVDRAVLGLAADKGPEEASSSAAEIGDAAEFDIMSASEWPQAPAASVLLTPSQCRTLWRQFASDANYTVQQAMATQDANRAASNRMPPLWAILAIAFLGFNELLAVLYNPLWLILFGILFMFGRTVYLELDIDAEMQRGLLPGFISLSGKFVPTIQAVTQRTVEAARQFINNPQALAHQVQHQMSEAVAAVAHANGDAADAVDAESSTRQSEASLRRRRDDNGGVEMTSSHLEKHADAASLANPTASSERRKTK